MDQQKQNEALQADISTLCAHLPRMTALLIIIFHVDTVFANNKK